MSERSIPRIDPSGTFLPIARLSLFAEQDLTDGEFAVIKWKVDYLKGDVGKIADNGETFELGPGLYLVTMQAVTDSGPTSLTLRTTCEGGTSNNQISTNSTAGGTTVCNSCQAFIPPTDGSGIPGVFAFASGDIAPVGDDATLTSATMLIEKFSNLS